jgi:hypothetical protein
VQPLRSTYQHAWATAVETVGTFIQQALKSSLGEEEWLRFFALVGSVIALKERTPIVPNTPEDEEQLFGELYSLATKLDVENRLHTYGMAIQVMEQPDLKGAAYFLLEIEPKTEVVNVRGFKRAEIDEASDEYLAVEKEISKGASDRDAVLVSVAHGDISGIPSKLDSRCATLAANRGVVSEWLGAYACHYS